MISGQGRSGGGSVLTWFGLFLVLGEFCYFLTLEDLLVLLKEKLFYDVLVFKDESFLLDFALSLFLVNGELYFLPECAHLCLMFIFKEGETAFAFRVGVFLPLLDLLLLEFLGFALDLMGFHVVFLSGELLLYFSQI